MPTKKELSEEINEMLDTEMDWNRLSKEDLENLHSSIKSGELLKRMSKALVKQQGKERVDEIVDEKAEDVEEFADEYYPGKYIIERVL